MIPYISCVKKDGYIEDILNSDLPKKRDAANATSLHIFNHINSYFQKISSSFRQNQ